MNRPLALRAEIVHHGRNARAKELLPKPVHDGARGERVVARNKPFREVQASEAAPVRIRNLRQEMWRCGLDDFAVLILPIAARQQA